MTMNPRFWKFFALGVSVFVIALWVGAWSITQWDWFVKQTDQPLGDAFNSLNALFGALAFGGLLLTIAMQMAELSEAGDELERTANANKLVALTAKEQAILSLYQHFSSRDFQEVKTSSHNILIMCVKNKEYCDFVISRFFVLGQLEMGDDLLKKVQSLYYNGSKFDTEQFAEIERSDRFKLDELFSFFSLLANRDDPNETIKNCDFFYSWWRPLFWMIATLQQQHYRENIINEAGSSDYDTAPYMPSVVRKLDVWYGFSPFEEGEKGAEEMWKYIRKHPKISSYGVAAQHPDPS